MNNNKKKSFLKRFSHNKGALIAIIILLCIFGVTIFAGSVATYDPAKTSLGERLLGPTLIGKNGGIAHILGTDQQGRDLYSRILYGARSTLKIAFSVTILGAMIGIVLGLLAGYFGGWTDMIIMRIVDVWASSPTFLVSLALVMVLGPGETTLIIAFLFSSWTLFCKMARSQVLTLRGSAMVESGLAIGASTKRILFKHIVPNIISPLVTTFVMQLANFINAEANLSFLGFGVQPPSCSWGLMIGDGRQYITSAWWIVFFPGLMIGITVLCLNIVGSWVREEFDPLSVKL
jgi:peptide/nickel transport system permease protein